MSKLTRRIQNSVIIAVHAAHLPKLSKYIESEDCKEGTYKTGTLRERYTFPDWL